MPIAAPYLDADELRASTFVRHVEIHETLGSTNDLAAELARQLDRDALPALIASRQQTAGRGRGKHTWWSNDGALTFSLLFEPAAFGISTASWPQLSLATGVAICDALELELSSVHQPPAPSPQPPRLGIKWPNDVLINGRKVCGILIESPGGSSPAKDRLIIGVGINVDNSWHEAPAEITARGTALCDVTGRTHYLQELLRGILSALSIRIEQLWRADPALAQSWQTLDVLSGEGVVITAEGRSVEGTARGIAEDGALILETADGIRRVYSGSVRQP